MKLKIQIWHFALFIWLLIFIIKFERIFELINLLWAYIKLLAIDFNSAVNQLEFELIDHLLGGLLFILIPVVMIIFSWQKIVFFRKKIFLSAAVIVFLIYTFLFAPLIADRNPDFYKDIAVTKLLVPLSSVKEIRLKRNIEINSDELLGFLNLKNNVIKLSYDNYLIYCDSVSISGKKVFCYQNGNVKTISAEEIEKQNGKYFLSEHFILGTDEFGRDIFTRLVYGTRLSLFIGLSAVLISFILGTLLGFLAGYKSGWIDLLLNRTTDLFLAFPIIFFIIFVLALFGNNMISVIIVLGFSGWMSLFKLVKSEVSSIKKKDFFISSKLLGMSPFCLMKREVLPIIMASVLVNITFQFGNVVLAESALSYLGLGLGNEYSSWGSMIQSGQEYILQSWWMIILPGLLLIITLLTINDLAKKIKEYYNPRVRFD